MVNRNGEAVVLLFHLHVLLQDWLEDVNVNVNQCGISVLKKDVFSHKLCHEIPCTAVMLKQYHMIIWYSSSSVTCNVQSSNVQFRIDPSAYETVIPEEVYKELQDVNPLKVPDK